MTQQHSCLNDIPSSEPSWWARDGRGIELCRVCDLCIDYKLARYRPEILSHYNEHDVCEPIEEDL